MRNIAKDVQVALQEDLGIQSLITEPWIGIDDAWDRGWIFDSRLGTALENTQRCAIVVSYAGGWQIPLDGNTNHFPAVVVDIWADPTRNPDHSYQYNDADDKLFKIYEAVFAVLHRTHRADDAGNSIFFNGGRIISSESLGEPDITSVTDGNGSRMMRCRFGISY